MLPSKDDGTGVHESPDDQSAEDIPRTKSAFQIFYSRYLRRET